MWYLLAFGIFTASMVTDFIYCKWFDYYTTKQQTASILLSGVLALISSCVTIVFVFDWSMIGPIVMGHMAGTWVSFRKRK